jgi:hypothetical protein
MGVNWLGPAPSGRAQPPVAMPVFAGGNWWSWAAAARWAPGRRHHRPDLGKVDDAVQALVKEG